MQQLNVPMADKARDGIFWMNQIEEVKVQVGRWQADINVHRGGFLPSDTKEGFGAAFLNEVDAAQSALNALGSL